MSRFWKRFLREGQGLFARGTKPQIWLGAFGKHPGWDDHIDDIGLETESLLLAKQILYVDGIGGQISSGQWEKLDEAQRLREFKHVFLWKRGDAFLIGRIWSSRDGKNRTQYPLVVCAHCLSIPFNWALTNVSECLEGVERQCKSARLADEVRGILGQALDQLRHKFAHPNVQSLQPDDCAFVERLGLTNDIERIYRIAYGVQTQLGCYLADRKKNSGSNLSAVQIRLPAVIGLAGETLSFWSRLLESQLRRGIPELLVLPVQETWIDVICGEPASREFYSLRANREILDVATEAREIPTEFRSANSNLVQVIANGLSQGAGPRQSGG